jgi:hypothetical protein
MRVPKQKTQNEDKPYQPVIAISPEAERVLQALEQGKRSQILPMPKQTRTRDWIPDEPA